MVGINISETRTYVIFYGEKIGGKGTGMLKFRLPDQLANDSVIAGVYARKYMPRESIILAVLAFEIVGFLLAVQDMDLFWPPKEVEEEVEEEPVVLDSPEPLPLKFGNDDDAEATPEPV